jgi:hypothetical protein
MDGWMGATYILNNVYYNGNSNMNDDDLESGLGIPLYTGGKKLQTRYKKV